MNAEAATALGEAQVAAEDLWASVRVYIDDHAERNRIVNHFLKLIASIDLALYAVSTTPAAAAPQPRPNPAEDGTHLNG